MNKKCIISGYSRKRYRKKCIKFCTIFSPPFADNTAVVDFDDDDGLLTCCLFSNSLSPSLSPSHFAYFVDTWLMAHHHHKIISCCRMLLYKAVPILLSGCEYDIHFFTHIFFISLVYMLRQAHCVSKTFVYRVHLLSTIMARATIESTNIKASECNTKLK